MDEVNVVEFSHEKIMEIFAFIKLVLSMISVSR